MKNSIGSHKQALIACFAFVLFFGAQVLHAQITLTYSYPEYNMEGDTIWHKFPPPDSTYVPNELILKFRNGILYKDSLCYDCYDIVEPRTRGKGAKPASDPITTAWFAQCKQTLMTQHFTLNIISDPIVRTILASNGVSYLRRMTAANPCADTLSLSRFHDTLHMDDFNWMVAEFNNDTSIVPTLAQLYLAYNGSVQVAEPNYYMGSAGPPRTPVDPQFQSGLQISLDMMGMPVAWGFDVGEESITVAVVDAGVDYFRCDLGGGPIPNDKVIGGWSFRLGSMKGIYDDATHGTQAASIIGALTNNEGCTGLILGKPNGMAGIAGGSGAAGTPNLGTGVGLVGYDVRGEPGDNAWNVANVASAILESGALSLFGNFGNGVDVINFSGGGQLPLDSGIYPITLRNAISEAWLNGSTFVSAKGDAGTNVTIWPADQEPESEVIAVTSSDQTKSRAPDGNWGYHTDLIAPGGEEGGGPNSIADALQYDGLDGPDSASGNPDTFGYFGKTSASTPHASGVVALLRGWMDTNKIVFAREDPEGMLEASALDLGGPLDTVHLRIDPDGTQYISGYDDHVGWGFLQADQLFTMLDTVGEFGYKLAHVEIPHDSLIFPPWPGSINYSKVIIYSADSNLSNIPIDSIFDVKVREITGTFSYAGLGFNTADSLYVWGNSGVGMLDTSHRGMANILPNWSEPWCGVTSGQLGNQNKIIPSGDSIYMNIGVPGIHHGYSTEVTCHTYQYQLFKHNDTTVFGYLPDSSKVGLGYTVFGATKFPSGVKSNGVVKNQFTVWPSIASASFNVSLDNSESPSQFIVIDAIGRTVFEESLLSGTDHFEVTSSELPSGLYLCQLITESGNEEAKIIVRH